MTHSNIDLIKGIKYKYNTENIYNNVEGSTHSFHNYMKTFSNATQSMEQKINNFKEIVGYTSSHSLTHSSIHSYTYSVSTFSFNGLTNSNLKHSYFGTISNYLATQSYSFNNSIGTYSTKFFTKVTHNITKLDNQSFVNIVSTINSTSLDESKKLITDKKVTVNGVLVTDINYQLTSLDIVRIGFEGHFINNQKGIAIIK
jgi:hypothetical protein